MSRVIKFFTALTVMAMLFTQVAFAISDGETVTDPYTDDPDIQVTLNGYDNGQGGVNLDWVKYSGGDLKYYKLAYSQTDPEPYYPVNDYLTYSDNPDDTSFVHTNIGPGMHYYRLCVITTDSRRGCSNPVSIDGGDKINDPIVVDIELTGRLDLDGNVDFEWDAYTGNDFKWYKLAYSAVDPSPTYADDGYEWYSGDVGETTYSYAKAPTGKSYYSLCVVNTAGQSGCSNSVTIDKDPSIYAEPDKTSTDTDVIKDVDDPYTDESSIKVSLEGALVDGYAKLNWSTYSGTNFKWYKVMRSQKYYAPYYLLHNAVSVSDSAGDTSYKDTNVPIGEVHYRVCVITTDDMRGCSNTVTLYMGATKTVVFDDIEGHWSEEYVENLAGRNVVKGREYGFEPDETVLRSEAVKMIVFGFDYDASDCNPALFPDMDLDDWFCGAATVAFKKEMVSGDGGKLSPDRPVTRAEAVKMLLEAKEVDVPAGADGSFKDVVDEDWFAGYADMAKNLGYIKGIDGNFEPERPITRAELAKIVYLATK